MLCASIESLYMGVSMSINEYVKLQSLIQNTPTVCPVKESGHLMEDYSVDTQCFGKISSGS